MGKVVEETYFCDVCGVIIEGKVSPVPRAIREIGYWADYRFIEYDNPRFCLGKLYLCEECKDYSDTHLIGMISETYSERVKYKWLKGQGIKKEKMNEQPN